MHKDDLIDLALIVGASILVLFLVFAPMIYASGSANSRLLKDLRGIELPWYQAAWVNVTITDSDVKLK